MAMDKPPPLTMDCYETALCYIPPQPLWAKIQKLRRGYDKAYMRWPPHINVAYPFVQPEHLRQACDTVAGALRTEKNLLDASLVVRLDSVGVIGDETSATVFFHDSKASLGSRMHQVRRLIYQSLGYRSEGLGQMHLIIAQTDGIGTDMHVLTLEKTKYIPPLQWDAAELHILIRVRNKHATTSYGVMKIWGSLSLRSFELSVAIPGPLGCPDVRDTYANSSDFGMDAAAVVTRHFSAESKTWQIASDLDTCISRVKGDGYLAVACYNARGDFSRPPDETKFSTLLEDITSDHGDADVVVLQDVTDNFICFLLENALIRAKYPFASHGPPDQSDLGPLPSQLNIVILSKLPFTAKYVALECSQECSMIVLLGNRADKITRGNSRPVVIAACHLSKGLTDETLIMNKLELQAMIEYLRESFSGHPWIILGDFNITTSKCKKDAAFKSHAMSARGEQDIMLLEAMLTDCGCDDAWSTIKCQFGVPDRHTVCPDGAVSCAEGEEDATYYTKRSYLDALRGLDVPQKRVLVKRDSIFRIIGFNFFGKPANTHGDNALMLLVEPGTDYWGIRCLLELHHVSLGDSRPNYPWHSIPICLRKAPLAMASSSELEAGLHAFSGDPAATREPAGQQAIDLVRRILENGSKIANTGKSGDSLRSLFKLIVVPVGSYAMGVWTAESDINLICVGNISPKTFFNLAVRKFRKAEREGIRIVRRIKARFGTVLDLKVYEIKIELQYCSSTHLPQDWSTLYGPQSDSALSSSFQTLANFKPARDMLYVQRSVPDFPQFRLSLLFLRIWAKSRGIYSARLGFIGGVQICVMLVRLYKLTFIGSGVASAQDVIATFFAHYGSFDWSNNMVYDPFFHREPRYKRSTREPMVILGWHGPSLNTAAAASPSTLKTLTSELQRMDRLISSNRCTWVDLIGLPGDRSNGHSGLTAAASEFLRSYETYVKLEMMYWGSSSAKGSQLVGWLESRIITLLADMRTTLPHLITRMWPARFLDHLEQSSESDKLGYQGFYLIGLEWGNAKDKSRVSRGSTAIEGGLQSLLQSFVQKLRANERYYASKSCWLDASIVSRDSVTVSTSSLESRDMIDSLYAEDISDSEDSRNDEDFEESLASENGCGDDVSRTPDVAMSRRNHRKDASHDLKQEGGVYLRPAIDIINRLRWDTRFDTDDYMVGYDDRFLGVQEKAVDLWKIDQTDEEFIPQHRILYFRRKSDNEVIWDRSMKKDLVFKSGLSAFRESQKGIGGEAQN